MKIKNELSRRDTFLVSFLESIHVFTEWNVKQQGYSDKLDFIKVNKHCDLSSELPRLERKNEVKLHIWFYGVVFI